MPLSTDSIHQLGQISTSLFSRSMGNALGLEDNAPPLFEIPSCQEFCVASTGRHGSGGAGASCGNMVQCDIHCEDPDDRRMRERTLLQHAVKTQLPAFGVRLPRGAQLQNSLPRIEVWKDREAASSSSSTSSTSLSTSRSTASGSSASISGGSAATSSALFPGGDTGGDIDVRVPQQAGGWLQVSDDEDTEEEEVHICTQDSVLNFSARGLNCVLTVLFNQKSSVQGANKSITFPATVEVEPRQEPLEQLHAAVHSVPEELQSDENRRHSKIDYKFYHLSIPSGNPKSVHFKLDRLDHDCAMQFQLDPDFGVQLNGLDILPLMFLERAFYEDDVQGLLMMSAGSCTGGPRVSTSSSALSSTASGSGGGKIVSQAAAPPHPYRGGGVMNQMNSSATRFSPSPGKGSIGRSSSSSSTPSLNMVVEQDINMATSSSLQLEPQPEPPTSSLVEPHRLPPLPGPRRSSRSLSPQRLQAKTAHAVRDGWVCTVPGLYTMKNEVELELRGMTGCEEVSLYLNGGEAVLETQVGLSNDFRKFKYL